MSLDGETVCVFLIRRDEDRLTDFAVQAEPESITTPASYPKTCRSGRVDARELNQLSDMSLSDFHI